jgi:hypothetical protein
MRGGRWQEASYPACAEGARRGGVDCSGRGRGHSQPLGLAAAARRGRSLRGLDPHTPWPRAAAAAAAAAKWRAVLKALGVTPCRPAGGQRDGNRG